GGRHQQSVRMGALPGRLARTSHHCLAGQARTASPRFRRGAVMIEGMRYGLPEGGDTTRGIIKIAILAVGGQGGGVLSGWVTDVAQRAGWHVQSTSVAGVAQRTGATIYYVEMMPRDPARGDAKPVLSLSPSPGDVDILIAAELAEA